MGDAKRQVSDGICNFCSGVYTKAVMGRHLEKCEKRHVRAASAGAIGANGIFHMQVEGRGIAGSKYWMHIEASGDAKLGDLDAFLRNIWLECCGHLSIFTIGGTEFISAPAAEDKSEGRKSMNITLGKLLFPGLAFIHEYDLGTTTELLIKVLSRRDGDMKGNIQLLARNNPPAIKCACGKEAVHLCSECIWDSGKGWLCNNCAKEHECGEDMLLPVINSPRTGMCGYTG